MEKIKILFNKYREIIMYLIFGVGTTAVDWCVTFVLYALSMNVHVADIIAWVAAVAFAYITNRAFVFESKKHGFVPVVTEISKFSASRLVTLGLQEMLVFVLYDEMELNKYLVKIIAAVIVVILNYILSKLIVFRKDK